MEALKIIAQIFGIIGMVFMISSYQVKSQKGLITVQGAGGQQRGGVQEVGGVVDILRPAIGVRPLYEVPTWQIL